MPKRKIHHKLTPYKRIFLIRFAGYASVLSGIFTVIALITQFGPLMIAEASYRKDQLFGIQRQAVVVVPTPSPSTSTLPTASTTPPTSTSDFGTISNSDVEIIKPVSTDYGIVIPKINANSKVIPNVDISKESIYEKALQEGVAAVEGSTAPGEPGNLYIFSHSVNAPFWIARYNAVFYLLRELEPGDQVIVYYQQRRYTYVVYDKTVTDPANLEFLTNRYDAPVLTLQTCDPPGLLYRRLIVRAKLLGS